MPWPHLLRQKRLGYAGMLAFGLVLVGFGLQPLIRDVLIEAHGVQTVATVVDAGSVPSSGGSRVGFIRYEFKDADGAPHAGQSSGYSGTVGESVLVEYAPSFPFVHRLVGEDRRLAKGWHWGMAGFGLLLLMAGTHSLIVLRRTWGLVQRLRRASPRLTGRVIRRSHDGRTLDYEYAASGRTRRRRTLPMPMSAWQGVSPGDDIALLATDAEANEVLTVVERDHFAASPPR